MSESFKPLDPLAELDRLAVDLDFDLDLDLDRDRDRDLAPAPDRDRPLDDRPLEFDEALPHSGRKVRILPVGIRSLSNSPGAAPHASLAREASDEGEKAGGKAQQEQNRERELGTTAKESDSAPQLQPIRRARAVRVDAWAVPASASWTRTHKAARKIRRVSRSTDWALPF